jgi:hypothetical protein
MPTMHAEITNMPLVALILIPLRFDAITIEIHTAHIATSAVMRA